MLQRHTQISLWANVWCEQCGEEFSEVHNCFHFYFPPDIKSACAWSGRDTQKVWKHICDTLSTGMQQFCYVLNTMMNMGLSGLTHKEKVNVAVTIFFKKVKEGDVCYQYQNFDATTCPMFRLFFNIKRLIDIQRIHSASSSQSASREQHSLISGTMQFARTSSEASMQHMHASVALSLEFPREFPCSCFLRKGIPHFCYFPDSCEVGEKARRAFEELGKHFPCIAEI